MFTEAKPIGTWRKLGKTKLAVSPDANLQVLISCYEIPFMPLPPPPLPSIQETVYVFNQRPTYRTSLQVLTVSNVSGICLCTCGVCHYEGAPYKDLSASRIYFLTLEASFLFSRR